MTQAIWEPYRTLLGSEVVDQLFQLASLIKGARIVNVSSTKEGGGVAEILNKMVPLMQGLGLQVDWEILEGSAPFYQCTKTFHNLFQGKGNRLPDKSLLKSYIDINAQNAERLKSSLQDADFVMIHDPQPLALVPHFPNRKGKWAWRCHIDTSTAPRFMWRYFFPFISGMDASVVSLDNLNQALPHDLHIIPPSIDPFTDKNCELAQEEVLSTLKECNIDPERKFAIQVSRFDRFKDPVGVIEAYKMAKKYFPGLQLALAGGGATDDPEGMQVYEEVLAISQGDPDLHVLNLPPDAHRTINALQRGADVILQKSTKEGFGLTVTEALWKSKPLIAGNAGGIRLQVLHRHTGLLVNTKEGAANQLRFLLQNPQKGKTMGAAGKELVKENFLITRHIRDYLTLMVTMLKGEIERLDLGEEEALPIQNG